MVLRSEESRLIVGGVILVASWLTTLYLLRQNKLLRTKRLCREDDSNLDVETLKCTRQQDTAEKDEINEAFFMEEIGWIQSPFPQRAGCPRQGTLSPHVKSQLVLHTHVSEEVLDGIMSYSHLWIIFSFHLNPRGKAKAGACVGGTSKCTSTKIRPPRAHGKKVGVLATRAPHRPNPVGLSLALLEGVVTQQLNGKRQTCLVLRGLDLVDGTPVYDVKPYVPWDCINYTTITGSDTDNADLCSRMKRLKVPSWVSADDALAQVTWMPSARDDMCAARKHLNPLYDSTNEGVEEACKAIEEVVAQDPRAMRDGRGESSKDIFEFTFGSLRIQFLVTNEEATITGVIVDEGDITASKGSYPHNLALRRLAEQEAQKSGIQIEWASPVREGVTRGLFELLRGGEWKPKQIFNEQLM